MHCEDAPGIGDEIAVITLELRQPLRVLDFTRLDAARGRKALSYLQPDYRKQLELRAFLRRLDTLISQPVVPGHEADYTITQTMSEFLRTFTSSHSMACCLHLRNELVDSTSYCSHSPIWSATTQATFRVSYVNFSLTLVATSGIRYEHKELSVDVDETRKLGYPEGKSRMKTTTGYRNRQNGSGGTRPRVCSQGTVASRKS